MNPSRLVHLCAALISLHVTFNPLRAAAEELTPSQVERLARLGRLWGEVRWSHPWILTRGIDWEKPLLGVIPKVMAAKDRAEEEAALTELLAALKDPSTRLMPPPGSAPAPRAWAWRWIEPGLLEVELGAGVDWGEVARLKEDLGKAKGALFDLRAQPESTPPAQWLTYLVDALPSREILVPGVRRVVHHGYRGQRNADVYFSGLLDSAWEVLPPAPGVGDRKVAFITDSTTPLSRFIVGLQQSGQALLVVQGTPGAVEGCARMVDLGDGYRLTLRTCELASAWKADTTLPAGAPAPRDAAWQGAVKWLRSSPKRVARAAPVSEAVRAVWRPDVRYPAPLPSLAERVLGAYRLWSTIRYFFPYLHLLDAPWDGALAAHLPEFVAASTPSEYETAVRRFAARTQDSHVGVVRVSATPENAYVDIDVLPIEGGPTVVTVGTVAKEAGLRPGDVVEAIDGEPIPKRVGALQGLVAASTPQSLAYKQLTKVLAGPKDSIAELSVRGADGATRIVRAKRVQTGFLVTPPGPAWRTLGDGTGYVDLRLLTVSEIAPMVKELARAPAIVFDMRGYPRGIVWSLAPHFFKSEQRMAAAFRLPFVNLEDPGPMAVPGSGIASFQPLDRAPEPYRGRTLMLIDERAVSQAEYTAMYLRAAAGTQFVGSATTGANGNITELILPGELAVRFTGLEVVWPDGGQLQRRGVQPDIPARPTLKGLREGRDEVLEAALEHIKRTAPSAALPGPAGG